MHDELAKDRVKAASFPATVSGDVQMSATQTNASILSAPFGPFVFDPFGPGMVADRRARTRLVLASISALRGSSRLSRTWWLQARTPR
jgi:hypothetical protein